MQLWARRRVPLDERRPGDSTHIRSRGMGGGNGPRGRSLHFAINSRAVERDNPDKCTHSMGVPKLWASQKIQRWQVSPGSKCCLAQTAVRSGRRTVGVGVTHRVSHREAGTSEARCMPGLAGRRLRLTVCFGLGVTSIVHRHAPRMSPLCARKSSRFRQRRPTIPECHGVIQGNNAFSARLIVTAKRCPRSVRSAAFAVVCPGGPVRGACGFQ